MMDKATNEAVVQVMGEVMDHEMVSGEGLRR